MIGLEILLTAVRRCFKSLLQTDLQLNRAPAIDVDLYNSRSVRRRKHLVDRRCRKDLKHPPTSVGGIVFSLE